MGVLNQLLVASPSEVQTVLASDDPLKDRDGVDCRGLDRVTLITLWALVESGSPDDEFDKRLDAVKIVSAGDQGPWVDLVPPAMLAALASIAGMDELEIESLAERWAATDELAGWEEVHEIVRDIGDKAESAVLENKTLLIWTCL